MHASALFSAAAAALLAGVARADIDFTFYDVNSCLGLGARNVTFTQDDTLTFDQHIYRAIRTFEHEGNTCEYTLTHDWSTAKSINAPAMAPMPDGYQCAVFMNENLQSIALASVTVFNCTGDGHDPS